MLDSRGFIHVPAPIRRTALVILALVCLSALYLTARYAYLDDPKDPKYADWILVGMSLVHMSFAGFAIALILFFTEKNTNYEPFTSPSGAKLMSIWSSIKLDQNLLLQPSDRLFWMQDIAMMTESFWRTSIRNSIVLSYEEPSSL